MTNDYAMQPSNTPKARELRAFVFLRFDGCRIRFTESRVRRGLSPWHSASR
jgi:hypothetical protein